MKIRQEDTISTGVLTAIANNKDLKPELRQRAKSLLAEQAEAQMKSIEQSLDRQKEGALRRAQAALETEKSVKSKQNTCSHIKRNIVTNSQEPHVRGQVMHDGRLVVFCQSCGKTYSDPPNPKEHWDPLPVHLRPTRGTIGSVVDPSLMMKAARERYSQDLKAAENSPVAAPPTLPSEEIDPEQAGVELMQEEGA